MTHPIHVSFTSRVVHKVPGGRIKNLNTIIMKNANIFPLQSQGMFVTLFSGNKYTDNAKDQTGKYR